MTMPAEPGTGAPGAPETGDPSTEPNTPTGAQPEPGGTDTGDWASLFEGMTPQEVKDRLDHARTWEKRAKTNKAKLEQLTAAGTATSGDGEPSLDELRQQYESERERADAAEERAVELAYTSNVNRVAAKTGLDAEQLLDSDRFRRLVGEELGDDFDDDDLRAAIEKVAKSKEFANNPRFTGGQRPPARSGADITGGPGALRQLTEDDLQRMTPEQIVAAQERGQLNGLLGIT